MHDFRYTLEKIMLIKKMYSDGSLSHWIIENKEPDVMEVIELLMEVNDPLELKHKFINKVILGEEYTRVKIIKDYYYALSNLFANDEDTLKNIKSDEEIDLARAKIISSYNSLQ